MAFTVFFAGFCEEFPTPSTVVLWQSSNRLTAAAFPVFFLLFFFYYFILFFVKGKQNETLLQEVAGVVTRRQ